MIPDFKKLTSIQKMVSNICRIGAFVRNPLIGIHTWVGSFDANSLYPNIARSLNLGFENIKTVWELPNDFKNRILALKPELDVTNYFGNNGIKVIQYVEEYERKTGNSIDRSRINIIDIERDRIYEITGKVKDEKDIKRVSLYKEILRATIDLIIEKNMFEKLDYYLKKYNLAMSPNFVFFDRTEMTMLNHAMTRYYTLRQTYQKEEKRVIAEIKKLKESIPSATLDEKKTIYKQMQILDVELTKYNQFATSFKLLMNSGYGAISHPSSRYFNVDVTNAITSTSQYIMKRCAIEISKLIKVETNDDKDCVVYGDTDSLYIDFSFVFDRFQDVRKSVDYLLNTFQPKVEQAFTVILTSMNAYDNSILKMKLEKFADSSFFQKRKKYVVRYVYKDGIFYENEKKLSFTGLSVQAINTPDIVEKWAEDGVQYYLDNNRLKFYDFIDELKVKFYNSNLQDIAMLKNLNNYKKYIAENTKPNLVFFNSDYQVLPKCPPTCRASAYHNFLIRTGKIDPTFAHKDGDKVYIINLKKKRTNTDLIAFSEEEEITLEKSDIDYKQMFQSVVLSNFKAFDDILKWGFEHQYFDEDF